MAVLERSELEASPLADLHTIANQVGLDGFRRLRKADLIDAILGEASAGAAARTPATASGTDELQRTRRRRPLRSRRSSETQRPRRGELATRRRHADAPTPKRRLPPTARTPQLAGDTAAARAPRVRAARARAAAPAPGRVRTRLSARARDELSGPRGIASATVERRGAHRRRRRRGPRQRLGLPACRPARALRRRRLHLRGAGPPL